MSDEERRVPVDAERAVEERDKAAGKVWEELTDEEKNALHSTWLAERKERARDLTRSARRSWTAMEGWGAVTSQEQWGAIQDQAAEDWLSGKAFLDMCGGERYLDPPRMALLLHLWHHFVRAYHPEGPTEYLCVAMALVGYHQFMRVNEVVGNLTTRLEHTFFESDPLEVRIVKRDDEYGYYDRMDAHVHGQEHVAQLGRELLPLLDRLNRLVLRNLKLLRDLKTTPISMTVQNYGQLNVGQAQTNLAQPRPEQTATTPVVQPAEERGA